MIYLLRESEKYALLSARHHMTPLSRILDELLLSLNIIRVGDPKFGWHQKSVGCLVKVDSILRWVRIEASPNSQALEERLARIETANDIIGVKKPKLISRQIVNYQDTYYGIAIMDQIEEPAISNKVALEQEFNLAPSWITSLTEQLKSLASTPTTSISCRQDLIKRRIEERYGGHPYLVEKWATIHGDLNWSNLTSQTPYIFDWEGWGKGPAFLGIYFLYAFSLNSPKTALQLKQAFPDVFEGMHAHICLLFVCSELMRMVELHGDHPELYPFLKDLSQEILNDR